MKKKKKLLTEQEREEIREIRLTEKGLICLIMAKHNLIPKVDGDFDFKAFEKFWDEFVYERDSREEKVGYSIKCKSDKRRKERAKNSDVPIVPLILGILAGSIIGKLLFLLLKVSGIL
jgi:hypothetical protein